MSSNFSKGADWYKKDVQDGRERITLCVDWKKPDADTNKDCFVKEKIK